MDGRADLTLPYACVRYAPTTTSGTVAEKSKNHMFDGPFSAGEWVVEVKPPHRMGRVWRLYSHGEFAKRAKLKNWAVVYIDKQPVLKCVILLRRAWKHEVKNGKADQLKETK